MTHNVTHPVPQEDQQCAQETPAGAQTDRVDRAQKQSLIAAQTMWRVFGLDAAQAATIGLSRYSTGMVRSGNTTEGTQHMTTPQLDAKTMEVLAQIIYERWSDRAGWIEWPERMEAALRLARADAREILQVLVERGWRPGSPVDPHQYQGLIGGPDPFAPVHGPGEST